MRHGGQEWRGRARDQGPAWAAEGGAEGGRPVAGGDGGLAELATRLLLQTGPDFHEREPRLILLPGRLPADLPVRLPDVRTRRVIGSTVQHADDAAVVWTVVLDLEAAPADALAAYEHALGGAGWRVHQPPMMLQAGGGFQAAFPGPDPGAGSPHVPPEFAARVARAPQQRMFCPPTGPGALFLTVTPRSTSTELLVRVDRHEWGPCAMEEVLDEGVAGRVPVLTPPAGVHLMPAGGGGGADTWRSEALAFTAVRAGVLEPHFAEQLAAGGWEPRGGAAGALLAWSVWQLPGEPLAQGCLSVLEGPEAERRSLVLTVTAAGGGPASVLADWSITVSRDARQAQPPEPSG